MSTVPAQTHPLVVAAQWLRLIGNQEYRTGTGGAPIFETCSQPDKYLERLATVVAKDGAFNGKSRYAERLAICLAQNKNRSEAMELFLAIVDGEEDILHILKPKEEVKGRRAAEIGKAYAVEEVADRAGKLGYEGLYRFGMLAYASGQQELAQKLLLELVEKTSTECYPIRLQDVRVMALMRLNKLGVQDLASGTSVVDELMSAEAHQY